MQRHVSRPALLTWLTLFAACAPSHLAAHSPGSPTPSPPPAVAPSTVRPNASDGTASWSHTEGSPGGGRYSPLADIDRTNVDRLQVAWTYRHGDYRSGGVLPDKSFKGTAFESTPILVEGRLVFTTPFNRIIALDPRSGEEIWTFDPKLDLRRRFANQILNRGVAYWRSGDADGPCASRIFLGTLDARLIAVDIATGAPCRDFGTEGEVNLLDGIEPLIDPWEYNVTSPPTVVGSSVVTGSSIADLTRRVMPPGAVRAYDARTGRQLWRFNTIPQAGELGAETWDDDSYRHNGGANVWSTMTADLDRGLLFLPVSTAGPDLFGGDRKGANLFSDALVALNAATGRRVWHFQTVHHDLWDYDLAAPPILVRVARDGGDIDAVVQLTKTGLVFILDRMTGKPLFAVEERPVPASDVEGEEAWSTQPFPTRPPPLVPHRLAEGDVWADDPKHRKRCKKKLGRLRNEGIFTPPSERGSILYPGATGGANWSGAAYDPESGWLYVPTNNVAMYQALERLPESNFETSEARPLRGGLKGIWWALTGKGTGLRYSMLDRQLLSVNGVLCNPPPWGTLAAVDLNAAEIRWQVPVGVDESGVSGLMNVGPPLLTAGGVVFHGGTTDQRLWAYDSASGEVLASYELPAGLHAGPMTYKLRPEGKQYLVVAPGGHTMLGSKLGDYVIAYVLADSVASEVRPDPTRPRAATRQ